MAFDVKQLMVDITKVGGQQQFFCPWGTYCGYGSYCWCSYISFCRFGTYTCWGSIFTCGGTYCLASETLQFQQGIDQETLTAVKEQLKAALKEVEEHERKLGESKRT